MSRKADRRSPNSSTHYVDPQIYIDEEIFREEQEEILQVLDIACHESELPNEFDRNKIAPMFYRGKSQHFDPTSHYLFVIPQMINVEI